MIIYSDPERLRQLVEAVTSSDLSDFYGKKYANAAADVSTAEQFQQLPFLTRADIADTHPDKRLYIPKSDVSFVSYTSGTTSGVPLVLYWSEVENYHFEPSLGTASRTPLILHPALNKNFGHTFIQQCRQAKTQVTPAFADFQNLDQSAVVAEKTSADGIFTTPTLASMIADQIDRHYDASRIRLLALFSENLTQLKRERLKQRYPNAEIANLYASSEIGQILFYPCRDILDRESDEFHFIEEALVALELADDGELILTTDQNKAFPLIRYRTGDYFEISDRECGCGKKQKLLKWSGRMDVDKMRIYGMEIKSEDVELALKDCVHVTGDKFQVHFYPESAEKTNVGGAAAAANPERVRIVVEVMKDKLASKTPFALAEAEELLTRELLTKWRFSSTATLQTAVDRGLVSVPEIVFVDELSLKTTKTRRLVNHIV